MSSTYTGNRANITPGSAVDVTIPSDGDALNAASVNVSIDELADYVAFLKATSFDGTYSIKKLLVDGTGNVSNANGDGTLVVSGGITSTTGNIVATAGNVGSGGGYLYAPSMYILNGNVTTTDATATTIVTFALPTGSACHITAAVSARQSNTIGAAYYKAAAYNNNAGTPYQLGTSDLNPDWEDDASWGGLGWTTSGANILVRVTGKAATTIEWSARVSVVYT